MVMGSSALEIIHMTLVARSSYMQFSFLTVLFNVNQFISNCISLTKLLTLFQRPFIFYATSICVYLVKMILELGKGDG